MTDTEHKERLFLDSLSERLRRIAPPWIDIRREARHVVILAHGVPEVWLMGRIGRIINSAAHHERGYLEVLTARNILDTLQDVISRSSGEPWPPSRHGRSDLPEAHASVDGDVLRMWYGESAEPALETDALIVSELFLDPSDL